MNLHEYQKRTANFIAKHPNAIISVDMGLGKTAATAVSCIREKRHWIGYEMNTEFYNRATARIKQTLAEPTLF